jgi:hypothetical protein
MSFRDCASPNTRWSRRRGSTCSIARITKKFTTVSAAPNVAGSYPRASPHAAIATNPPNSSGKLVQAATSRARFPLTASSRSR